MQYVFHLDQLTLVVDAPDETPAQRLMELMYDAFTDRGWSVTLTRTVEEVIK